MKIKAIYDNEGDTLDRYTVYYDYVEQERGGKKFWACLGMSNNPFHPQGYGEHGSGMLGRHNGKRIKFSQLPRDCQALVLADIKQSKFE